MGPTTYNPTFVFEFETVVPLTKGMLKKIKENFYCDDVTMNGSYKGKITYIEKTPCTEYRLEDLTESLISKINLLFKSISKHVWLYNYKIFLT